MANETPSPLSQGIDQVVEVEEQSIPASSRRYKRKISIDDDINREILATLKSIPTNTNMPPEEDDGMLFFKSLVPKIKSLDDLQKMELQAEIHSVVLKHLKKSTRYGRWAYTLRIKHISSN